MIKRRHRIPATLIALMLTAASSLFAAEGFLTIKEARFVDPAGRQVILHGINVGEKHKKNDYMSWHRPEDFARMRQWGFNCVRLLLIWAAIEPQPGHYDDAYLRQIDRRIAWAKANELYVLLDMHQDLWGEKVPGGDGAPPWATLDERRPHHHAGQSWSDAYFSSSMIHTSFDNFWANKPGPDGVGIQERFALMWQHVASRYADEPAVIGYDLFNEPFPGSPILLAQMLMARHVIALLKSDGTITGSFKFADLLADRQIYQKVYGKLAHVDAYRSFLASSESVFKLFERNRLAIMYNRVAKAIRHVDANHILFIEPCMYASGGFGSDLQPIIGPDGRPDPLQALAPHVYDAGTDTPDLGSVNEPRMRLIFNRAAALAKRLNMPMLVGEWGAFGAKKHAQPAARLNVRLFEESLASETYWFFNKAIDQTAQFEMLQRPYPSAVAGTLLRYNANPNTRSFECVWTERPTITQSSRFYLPATWYPHGYRVSLTPVGERPRAQAVNPSGPNHYLIVPPTGRSLQRRLLIRPKP